MFRLARSGTGLLGLPFRLQTPSRRRKASDANGKPLPTRGGSRQLHLGRLQHELVLALGGRRAA